KFQLAAHRPRALTGSQPGALKAQEMEGICNEILMCNGHILKLAYHKVNG
ncbi:hypothetical protein QTP86_013792, partial [Hemibagrus guttatus]